MYIDLRKIGEDGMPRDYRPPKVSPRCLYQPRQYYTTYYVGPAVLGRYFVASPQEALADHVPMALLRARFQSLDCIRPAVCKLVPSQHRRPLVEPSTIGQQALQVATDKPGYIFDCNCQTESSQPTPTDLTIPRYSFICFWGDRGYTANIRKSTSEFCTAGSAIACVKHGQPSTANAGHAAVFSRMTPVHC